MTQLDQEDIEFLEMIADELGKIDSIYLAEATELRNIIFRARED